ncbi:MAG TPA: YbdD/YjiX family protein [Candidatus Cybelea sp.]|nr:YbdD/YjiX family protein [Candidatus Cybelea sp.]
MRKVQSKATSLLRGGWVWLRQVSGDAAYENYLRAAARHPDSGSPPLSRAEFYLDSLHRRYSTVSRCC